jgi:hypothetical protein
LLFLSSSLLELTDVGNYVAVHLGNSGQGHVQFSPEGEDEPFAEAELSSVEFLHIVVFEVAGDFEAQFLLLAGDLVELETDQCSPADVALEVQAGIADVAGME